MNANATFETFAVAHASEPQWRVRVTLDLRAAADVMMAEFRCGVAR